MQYSQKHVIWGIISQNRSSGLTPSCANVRTKKLRMGYILPCRGAHAPEPIDILFGVLSGLPDVIISAKLCVDRWTGFCVAAPQKVSFPILFPTTLTTNCAHYCADRDLYSSPVSAEKVDCYLLHVRHLMSIIGFVMDFYSAAALLAIECRALY